MLTKHVACLASVMFASATLFSPTQAANACFAANFFGGSIPISTRTFTFQISATTLKQPGMYTLTGYETVIQPTPMHCNGVNAFPISGTVVVSTESVVMGFRAFQIGMEDACTPPDFLANLSPTTLTGTILLMNNFAFKDGDPAVLTPVPCN